MMETAFKLLSVVETFDEQVQVEVHPALEELLGMAPEKNYLLMLIREAADSVRDDLQFLRNTDRVDEKVHVNPGSLYDLIVFDLTVYSTSEDAGLIFNTTFGGSVRESLTLFECLSHVYDVLALVSLRMEAEIVQNSSPSGN